MKLKPILAILKKDLRDGAKNYQIILMVLTPIILSLLFSSFLSSSRSRNALPEIGIISNPRQPLINALSDKGLSKKIIYYKDRQKLESDILEGKVRFGIILPEVISANTNFKKGLTVTLLYPPHIPDFGIESLKTAFESEIRAQLKLTPPPLPFEFKLEAVSGSKSKTGSISESMFPMLLVMSMGMVGFLALPMAIVEEKEKGTLNAIFLTPIKTSEFIVGKTLFSFLLSFLTIFTILTLNGKWGDNWPYVLLFSILGILMVVFLGLVVSLFAKTQGSVNAIGTPLFLFFQMIPSLQHSSELIGKIAPLVPSTYLFSGFRKALFLDLSKVEINLDIYTVASLTCLAYIICFVSFKLKKADK
ncbi:MAG: ABC transporter permease [Candidatus Rifleibacteriota bacterium]